MSDIKPSPRRRLLDLAPLELDCMNTLWPIGQATVREIRDLLAERRPRAYTTIMTIMDRLARKGVVERVKAGRAYVYRARLTADEARRLWGRCWKISSAARGRRSWRTSAAETMPSVARLPGRLRRVLRRQPTPKIWSMSPSRRATEPNPCFPPNCKSATE
jgi:predicted transcriptional regulator